jgi:hypothetical protein
MTKSGMSILLEAEAKQKEAWKGLSDQERTVAAHLTWD